MNILFLNVFINIYFEWSLYIMSFKYLFLRHMHLNDMFFKYIRDPNLLIRN